MSRTRSRELSDPMKTAVPLAGGWLALVIACLSGPVGWSAEPPASAPSPGGAGPGDAGKALSPAALVVAGEGAEIHVACATGQEVAVFDPSRRQILRRVPLDGTPTGLALSADGRRLYVTVAGPESQVVVVARETGAIEGRMVTGHTAMSPVLSPEGGVLYVCNRFDDAVVFLDVRTGQETRKVRVRREPVAAALTRDGRHLLVANHLHDGPADADDVAAVLSVIDVAAGKVVKELRLPNGSGAVNDIQVSPDGRYAFVTHILARFHLPTTQLERGWMNTNAGTLVDLSDLSLVNTVLLDSVDSGAANPWGVAWSADGRTLFVAHAGTHEISVIDFPALVAKLARVPVDPAKPGDWDPSSASRSRADVPNDLSFLVGLRQRVKVAEGDRGPRAVAVGGGRLYVANYFSDTLSVLDPAATPRRAVSLPLGPRAEPSVARQGEAWFHDATICFQGWQSCATCHPGEARVDALNWDLLNDDIGNPKNNKSLLLSHRTPPAMSLGVRETAETAVRAGIRHILFTVQPEEVAEAMDVYLKGLKPVPSPQLVKGRLSPAARRGQKLFVREDVGCAVCHPADLYTDLKHHDVGTRGRYDGDKGEYDTPTLVEIWRTAPYLHDGSAPTVRDLFGEKNREGRHGRTSQLSPGELDDLVAYVLSL